MLVFYMYKVALPALGNMPDHHIIQDKMDIQMTLMRLHTGVIPTGLKFKLYLHIGKADRH